MSIFSVSYLAKHSVTFDGCQTFVKTATLCHTHYRENFVCELLFINIKGVLYMLLYVNSDGLSIAAHSLRKPLINAEKNDMATIRKM